MWVKDTMKALKFVRKVNKSIGLAKKEVTVREDSETVSIDSYYILLVNPTTRPVRIAEELNYILDLLQMYEEYPQHMFTLSFRTQYFYEPTFSHLKYQYVYKIYELTVKELPQSEITYTYFKGSLHYKTTLTKDEKGKVSKRLFELYEDQGKITKKEVELRQ